MNADYPQGDPANSVLFDNPSIECCNLTCANIIDNETNDFIRDSNGVARIHAFQVMVKNGWTSTFDSQCQIRSPPTTALDDSDSDSDSDSDNSITSDTDDEHEHAESPPRLERAYLYRPNDDTKILDAIYGGVYRAPVLERVGHDTDWRMTGELCAVKAMRWDMIMQGRRVGKIENPRTEIAAMILLRDCYDPGLGNASAATVREAMRETNIVMPLDFLYDNENLYIIMPYCDGGELFDRCANGESFTEEECRTEIFPQMLNGLGWFQRAKICHRDLSLENFVLDGEGERQKLVIIDLGMALKIPYSVEGTRRLISQQDRCGKGPYISPEIYNQEPFDGHAVDLWAAGIILFILLVGFHPWKQDFPRTTNRWYSLMSGGELVLLCQQWNILRSELSLTLMENMLRSNVRDRLCLGQILTHGWLVG